MEALLVSTLTVALAEIGDKTQLLALLLAARYRRPWPIVAGIVAATLLPPVMPLMRGAGFSGGGAAIKPPDDGTAGAVAESLIASFV